MLTIEALQKQNEQLRETLQLREETLRRRDEEVRLRKEELRRREEEIQLLVDQLRKMKRQFFASKSERLESWDDSQLVFNEMESTAKSLSAQKTETITYSRKKPGRRSKPLPESLPREVVCLDLSDQEKTCQVHGCEMRPMGEDVTEKLKVQPAKMWVLEEHRPKYCCPQCEGNIKQRPCESVLPGTVATPELLSYLVFSKFFQGLPFYRQETLFGLFDVDLSRARMSRWLVDLSEKLVPIYNLLLEKAEGTGYLQIDQTRLQVLKEKGRKAQSKSAMWVRGSPELGIALFQYHPSQAGYVARELLGDFKGTLQSDAHGAFDQVDVGLQLGCLMHVRRKFFEALKGTQKQRGRAEHAIKVIRKIYEFEERYKTQNFSPEKRQDARERDVRPLLKSLKSWSEEQRSKVPPSTDLGKAIKYFLAQWERLLSCLESGRYELDNGWCERVIRKFAIGRNNWLFCDTVKGAEASSLYYSLMVTAKLNDKNPYDVMVKVLQDLPKAERLEDFEKLTALFLK